MSRLCGWLPAACHWLPAACHLLPQCLAPHLWGRGVLSDATRGEGSPQVSPLSLEEDKPGRTVWQLHWERLRADFSDCPRTLTFPQDAPPLFYPCHAHWHARMCQVIARCQSVEAPPTLNPHSAEPHLAAGEYFGLMPMPTNAFLPG